MLMFRRLISICLLLAAAAAQERPSSAPAEPGFRISGTVVNALTGQALANTEVEVGLSQQPDVVASLVTGSDGRFHLDGLPRGKYWLVAQRTGFAQQGFEEHEGFFTGIVVGPNLDSGNLVFRLRPDASISGTLTDEAGEPVRDAQVMLFRTGVQNGRQITARRGQSQTDDLGHYRFGHLRPGQYFIAVSASPWYAQIPAQQRVESNGKVSSAGTALDRSPLDVAYPITYYSSVTDSNAAVPIVLKPGDHATADVGLIAVPALHLRISDPDADPSSPADVRLMAHVFGEVMTPTPAQSTSVDGAMEVDGVAPGQYLMSLRTYARNRTQPSARAQEVDVSDDVEINAPDQSVLTEVVGKVLLDGEQKLPPQVFLRMVNPTTGQGVGAQVSAKGDFQLSVAPGKYELAVFNVPKAIVGSLSATGARVVGSSVEISGGGSLQLNVSLTRGLGNLDGIALRDGNPKPGAMIVLVPEDPENNVSLFRRDQSDSDGTFSLRSVLPGNYTVLAIENGWDLAWQSPTVLRPYLKQGTVVEVGPGRKYDVKVKAQ
jgi:hypothetical protein